MPGSEILRGEAFSMSVEIVSDGGTVYVEEAAAFFNARLENGGETGVGEFLFDRYALLPNELEEDVVPFDLNMLGLESCCAVGLLVGAGVRGGTDSEASLIDKVKYSGSLTSIWIRRM